MKLTKRALDSDLKNTELLRFGLEIIICDFFDFNRNERVWATCKEVCELIEIPADHRNLVKVGIILKKMGCKKIKTGSTTFANIPAYKNKLPGQSKAECIIEGYEEATNFVEEKTDSPSVCGESEFFEG